MNSKRDIQQHDLTFARSTMQKNLAGANVDNVGVSALSRQPLPGTSPTPTERIDDEDFEARGGKPMAEMVADKHEQQAKRAKGGMPEECL